MSKCINQNWCYTGKVVYASESRAWEVAAYLVEHCGHRDLKAYHCHVCGRYHLTTAKVQLNSFFWRPFYQWRRGVRNWFIQRGEHD